MTSMLNKVDIVKQFLLSNVYDETIVHVLKTPGWTG